MEQCQASQATGLYPIDVGIGRNEDSYDAARGFLRPSYKPGLKRLRSEVTLNHTSSPEYCPCKSHREREWKKDQIGLHEIIVQFQWN